VCVCVCVCVSTWVHSSRSVFAPPYSRASRVPVGQDQTQHLELARDVAIAFNRHYGVQLFAPPLPMPGGCCAAYLFSPLTSRANRISLFRSRCPSGVFEISCREDE